VPRARFTGGYDVAPVSFMTSRFGSVIQSRTVSAPSRRGSLDTQIIMRYNVIRHYSVIRLLQSKTFKPVSAMRFANKKNRKRRCHSLDFTGYQPSVRKIRYYYYQVMFSCIVLSFVGLLSTLLRTYKYLELRHVQ